MSALEFFNSARQYKREASGEPAVGLTDAEVKALQAVVSPWEAAGRAKQAPAVPHSLKDASAFYGRVRAFSGDLEQSQVDGFNALLKAMGDARWPCSWCAYGLATAWHETARTMQPVREAYWVKNAEAWRKAHLKYYPHYGRGFVQLTWPFNYEKADHELGLGGKLIADLDLALRPDIAARIMVAGMEAGWFTAKSLKTYLPIDGAAGFDAFKEARRIINGTDKASEIAKLAMMFQDALAAGGWG